MTKGPPKKPWQKTLYGNEGYPDNYTDPLFLKDLQKNVNVQIFKFPEAVLGATKITHQISLIVVFLLIFNDLYIQPHYIPPEYLLIGSCVTTAFGYILYVFLQYAMRKNHLTVFYRIIRDDIKTAISFLVFGYILSPMLHTLTNSISTDTIFTVTFFVFLLHLICFDYGLPASIVSNAISLNAVIFGALCLASRLNSSFHAFVLLVVAVQLFALYPYVAKSFERNSNLIVRIVPVVCVVAITSLCLAQIAPILFVINSMMLMFVEFLYPLVFCYVQKYKNNIHGPWDEAVVDVDVNFIAADR